MGPASTRWRELAPAGLAWCLPVALYWLLLLFKVPSEVSGALSALSTGLLLATLVGYYLAFRAGPNGSVLAGLGLTMLLTGAVVSFLWTSGRSDTDIIGGLLPYKDAKNYYFGALQILNGLPLQSGVNAVRRPLFPGLLSSLLFLTGDNLKIVTALLAQLAGVSLFLSARLIRREFGPAAASLFATLLFFHIQPRLGFVLSEVPGFTLGCLAFSILWIGAERSQWRVLGLGMAVLMAAISTRAGAFMIFPGLAAWCGWIYRGKGRYSLRAALLSGAAIAVLYFAFNQGFSRLLSVPLSEQWDNFAYAMYGQAHGGTGWHSAIEDLHTTDTPVVAAAAWAQFIAQPGLLLQATAQAYRDFFLPGDLMIFPLGGAGTWAFYPLWAAVAALLLLGIWRAIKGVRHPGLSLLIAGLVGILLSIPFLPPIDGGARFHASSAVFLFALPAAALAGRAAWTQAESAGDSTEGALVPIAGIAIAVLFLTAVLPVAIYRLKPAPKPAAPACAAELAPFVIQAMPNSSVNLIVDPSMCGMAPEICLRDFEANATDKANDDFIQAVLAYAHAMPGGVRITPGMNLVDSRFGYFVERLASPRAKRTGQLVSGCAMLIETQNSRLYQIESASGP